MERGIERRVAHPVVRPGKAAQLHRHRAPGGQRIEPGAEFATRVGRRHGVIAQPKAAARQIALAIGRRVETLRLDRRIGSHAGRGRHRVAIAALDAGAKTLAVERRGKLIARRGDAVGGEPVVGEGKRRADIRRPKISGAVNAGLECIAAPGAERLRQAPVGAGARRRKAQYGIGADMVIGAGRKPIGRGREGVGADIGIAIGGAGAAEPRAPYRPALVDALSGRRLERDDHRGPGRALVIEQAALQALPAPYRGLSARSLIAPVSKTVVGYQHPLAIYEDLMSGNAA